MVGILFILLLRQSFLPQFVKHCLLRFLFFLFEFVFVALLSEDVGTEYVFVLFITLDLEGLKLILVSFSQLFNFQLITINLNLRVRNLRLAISILCALVLIKVDISLVFLDFVVRIQLVLLCRQHLSLSELARNIVLDASGEDLHISDLEDLQLLLLAVVVMLASCPIVVELRPDLPVSLLLVGLHHERVLQQLLGRGAF